MLKLRADVPDSQVLPPTPPGPASTEADSDEAVGQPWWQRRAVLIAGFVAGVVGMVGVVAGVVMLGMASSARSDADEVTAEIVSVDADADAARVEIDGLNAEIEALEADQEATAAEIDSIETAIESLEADRDAAQQELDALITATGDVADAADALSIASVDATAAYNEYYDVMNEAVDLYNQGATVASNDLLNTRGTETLAAFEAAVEAEAETLAQFQETVNALREEVGDDG
jgi:chromosome segregation ATPase